MNKENIMPPPIRNAPSVVIHNRAPRPQFKAARPTQTNSILNWGEDGAENAGVSYGNFEEALYQCPPDAPLFKEALKKCIAVIKQANPEGAWKKDYAAANRAKYR